MANSSFFVSRSALLVLLVLPLPARAALVSYGEVAVAVAAEPKGMALHGYGEYRIQVANRSSDTAHSVTLTVPADTFAGRWEDTLRSVRRTVEVAPGTTATVALLVPMRPPMYGG